MRRPPPAGQASWGAEERSDALLLGRQTFTDFRGYWRDLADDTTGISDSLNAQHKYVVSRTLTEPESDARRSAGGRPAAAGVQVVRVRSRAPAIRIRRRAAMTP